MSARPDDELGVRHPVQPPLPYAPPPMQQPYAYEPQFPPHYGYGPPPWSARLRRPYPIETKPFLLTSEFVGALLAIAGIVITAASSDAFGAWRAWILITAVVVGYMISRGIAKSGTRSHAEDPREQFGAGGLGSSGRASSAGRTPSAGRTRLRSTADDDAERES